MAKKKLSSFDRAFVAARRSGAKDFSFGGKKFSTKQKGEGGTVTKKAAAFKATPAKAPVPAARPATAVAATAQAPSGRMFGIVGRGGPMNKRLVQKSDVPAVSTPKSPPTPTPRPASPRERQAKRTEAYLTQENAGSLVKMRKGMDRVARGGDLTTSAYMTQENAGSLAKMKAGMDKLSVQKAKTEGARRKVREVFERK